jgi:hypothetical protein
MFCNDRGRGDETPIILYLTDERTAIVCFTLLLLRFLSFQSKSGVGGNEEKVVSIRG